MKVTATTTDTAIITTMTDKFWQALTACRLIPGNRDGELREEPYGSEDLIFSLGGEDTDTPSWSVYGCSSEGNSLRVSCDNTRPGTPIITVTADTRRHALRDSGNMAGLVFRQMLCRDVTSPTGHMIPYDPPVEEMETVVLPMEDILSALTVKEYDSWRQDSRWWDCGLTPQPTSGQGWQVVEA